MTEFETRQAFEWILAQLSQLFLIAGKLSQHKHLQNLGLINLLTFFHPPMLLPPFAFTVILLVIGKRLKKSLGC